MPPKSTALDETSRINLPIRLAWVTLVAVAVGAVFASGVYWEVRATKAHVVNMDSKIEAKIDVFERKFDDHERRLIRIEAKTGIAKTGRENAQGWGSE